MTLDTRAAPPFESELVRLVGARSEFRDPYSLYRRMREEDPVYYSIELGTWFVTGFEPLRAMTRDNRLSTAMRWAGDYPGDENMDDARGVVQRSVIFVDPPRHDVLRRMITPFFTVKGIEARRPTIHDKIMRLLDSLEPGNVDFLQEVGYALPLSMTCDLMGLPFEDAPRFREWSELYIAVIEHVVEPEVRLRANQAFAEFRDYIEPFLRARYDAPTDDMISRFVEAERAGELTHDDVVAYCLFMMMAAHATSANLLTNSVYCLLRNPDQWALLRQNPELARTATEEVLRYEPPARNLVPRWATEDLELGGRAISKGQRVVGIVAAANRDPAVFDDPDKFDITRMNNRQIGFGLGSHMCSGAALARAEEQELLAILSQRFPELSITEEPVWMASYARRGLRRLLVSPTSSSPGVEA